MSSMCLSRERGRFHLGLYGLTCMTNCVYMAAVDLLAFEDIFGAADVSRLNAMRMCFTSMWSVRPTERKCRSTWGEGTSLTLRSILCCVSHSITCTVYVTQKGKEGTEVHPQKMFWALHYPSAEGFLVVLDLFRHVCEHCKARLARNVFNAPMYITVGSFVTVLKSIPFVVKRLQRKRWMWKTPSFKAFQWETHHIILTRWLFLPFFPYLEFSSSATHTLQLAFHVPKQQSIYHYHNRYTTRSTRHLSFTTDCPSSPIVID